MGDAVVSAVVSDVIGRLTSLAFNEFVLVWGLDDDVSALKESFRLIGAVLSDAEAKKGTQKAVEIWLRSLRSASLKVENVLDEVSTEAMLQRLHKERGIQYRVRAFLSSHHNRFMVRRRIAHKVKEIRRKLDVIKDDGYKFGLTQGSTSADGGMGIGGDTMGRETSSLVLLSEIYGRDEEIEMVAQTICNKDGVRQDNGDDVRVFAIWGMGGMGKTTLAQAEYNNESVKTHFELKCWVYVSMEFDVKKLTKGILESLGCPCPDSLDKMQETLQEKLRGKRFLMVLDDVWNEDERKWNDVRKALCCGDECSVILVTTRNPGISRMMAKFPAFQHELGRLSEDDSWLVFKKLVFGGGRDEGNTRELERLGKEIVKKCKGLPLAVRSLGSLMRSKNNASEWQLVNESEIRKLEENDDYFLQVLKLSYDDLQPHLKRCFAFCSIFPKGYEMEKEVLIEMWMANGFIPSTSEVDLYALGEDVFNRLVSRSFFQLGVKEYVSYQYFSMVMKNKISVCKVHDLMHDLARYVMKDDCVFGEKTVTPDEVLHLSSSSPYFLFLENQRWLRSIIFLNEYNHIARISEISKHMYLRVLYCTRILRRTLPDSVCKLKHLRYLNMSDSYIVFLPESIVYLQNLQVLVLKGCELLRKLPECMRYMKKLQHLDIERCSSLRYMPVGMKELGRLRVLSKFIVGRGNGLKIGELGGLNLLGGELELKGLENVGGLEEARSANLKHKTNLTSLVLSWTATTKAPFPRGDEEVVEGLEPAATLKELEIAYYMGKIPPSWMVNLRNLVVIVFYLCEKCECIPPLGKFPSLSSIHIELMGSLEGFHEDDNTSTTSILFPSLQHLVIKGCRKLASLPNNLPTLEYLEIRYCNGLVCLPNNLPKLTSLKIWHCDGIVCLPNNLPTLEYLEIGSCNGLVCLPNNLPKLTSLEIWKCDGIVCLPNNLPKLTSLEIEKCDGLSSLADEMLPSLTSLTIQGCEKLTPKYKKKTGKDWPKISHIPNIKIT